MSWFKRKNTEDMSFTPRQDSRVEIELHKSASKEAKAKADKVNAHVQDLLVANGFTVKIYLAAGGHLPVRPKNGNGQ
jgi:hypothetical protein